MDFSFYNSQNISKTAIKKHKKYVATTNIFGKFFHKFENLNLNLPRFFFLNIQVILEFFPYILWNMSSKIHEAYRVESLTIAYPSNFFYLELKIFLLEI